MEHKLNQILLIDDDESVNFINEMVIRLAKCAENVVVLQSAIAALEYLKSNEGEVTLPDLIFLDINMPAMNGWEFLEEYRKLEKPQQKKPIVVMLTTSVNPDDEERAIGIKEIDEFKTKPLTRNLLENILQRHFSYTHKKNS